MSNVCERKWAELAPTSIGTARHCDACRKNVFYVRYGEELNLARTLKRCLAINREGETELVVGNAAPRWPIEAGARVYVELDLELSGNRLSELKQNFPVLFTAASEATLLRGEAIDLGAFQADEVAALRDEFARHAPEFALRIDALSDKGL